MINLQIQKQVIKKQITDCLCPFTQKLKYNFKTSKTAQLYLLTKAVSNSSFQQSIFPPSS